MVARDCWYCRARAHMEPTSAGSRSSDQRKLFKAFICANCQAMSIGVVQVSEYAFFDHDVYDDASAWIEWLPLVSAGRRFEEVPSVIAEAASEAYSCHSFGAYRAAVLMARSVVEALAKDKGHTSGNLASKIDALVESRLIPPLMGETAHEIRFIGNEMAHGDFVNAVSEEECDDVLSFMEVLLESVYEQPMRVRRFREARQRKREVGGT